MAQVQNLKPKAAIPASQVPDPCLDVFPLTEMPHLCPCVYCALRIHLSHQARGGASQKVCKGVGGRMRERQCVVGGFWLGDEETGVLAWLWADLLGDTSPCSSQSPVCMMGNLPDSSSAWCVPEQEHNFCDMLFVGSVRSPSPQSRTHFGSILACC